ncbi:Pro-kumamolisin, activation domain-containing protein [Amylostereum chailletii]|nr:Pro-kumamolisin, activation domain-containing protein [Amylostereum chailletii]
MIKASFVFFALVASAAAASLDARDLLLHERRDDVPTGFTNDGAAPASTVLRLRLGLVQNDIVGLQDKLIDVSTPSSANYGKHLSKQEVNAYVAPKEDTVDAVQAWLSSNGINATSLSPTGDWLGFETTVEHANDLFDASFSTFTHQGTGAQAVRTLSYSIPASLKGHLDLVHPTVTFPNPSRSQLPLVFAPLKAAQSNLTALAAPASCNTAITPTCVQELYGIPTTLATQSSNKIAVSGFIEHGPRNVMDVKDPFGD